MKANLFSRFRQLLSSIPSKDAKPRSREEWSNAYLELFNEWRNLEEGDEKKTLRDYVSSHAEQLSLREKKFLRGDGKKHLSEKNRPFFRCFSSRHTNAWYRNNKIKVNMEQLQNVEVLDVPPSGRMIVKPRRMGRDEETKKPIYASSKIKELYIEGNLEIPLRVLQGCDFIYLKGLLNAQVYDGGWQHASPSGPFFWDSSGFPELEGVTVIYDGHINYRSDSESYYTTDTRHQQGFTFKNGALSISYNRLRISAGGTGTSWLERTSTPSILVTGSLKSLYVRDVTIDRSGRRQVSYLLSNNLVVENFVLDDVLSLRRYHGFYEGYFYGAKRVLLKDYGVETEDFSPQIALKHVLVGHESITEVVILDSWDEEKIEATRNACEYAGVILRVVNVEEWASLILPEKKSGNPRDTLSRIGLSE